MRYVRGGKEAFKHQWPLWQELYGRNYYQYKSNKDYAQVGSIDTSRRAFNRPPLDRLLRLQLVQLSRPESTILQVESLATTFLIRQVSRA